MYHHPLKCFRRRVGGRRWSTTGSAKPASCNSKEHATTLPSASTRSVTPGTVRVAKRYGANTHEAELDSSLARIIGSDWGDRSHQPVSLPMRIYWVVFALVLGNGLYTYFAGKDESFLVEKLKKKADEKLGVQVEKTEFQAMAEECAHASQVEHQLVTTATTHSTSVSNYATSGMPFLAPGVLKPSNARHAESKKELEQQLAQLRKQEQHFNQQVQSGEAEAKEELELQLRMIDIQKKQVKRKIKLL